MQVGGDLLHESAALIASVVQHDGDRYGQIQCREFIQHEGHVLAMDVGIGGDGDELMGYRIQGAQDTEPLPATGSGLPVTDHTPHPT